MTLFKTGIFLTGALGDFINALPALKALRLTGQAGEITLIGNPLWLPLSSAGKIVDKTLSMERLPLYAGFQPDLTDTHPLSLFLKDFDLIISWFGDREGTWERNLKRISGNEIHVYPFHQYLSFNGHVSEYYLKTLQDAGLFKIRDRPFAGRALMIEPVFEGPYLCVQPGSGSKNKNWPKANFLEVLCQASRRWTLPSHVLLGPAEDDDQRSCWQTTENPFLFVHSDLPILDAAGILAGARLYVGNDSGITHLAAALGTPTIALFGPTDPHRWAPVGRKVKVIRKDIPCSPCPDPAACERQKQHCLEQIPAEEVLLEIENMLTVNKEA